MSMIAMVCAGDTTVLLRSIQSLDPKDEVQHTYELTFMDGPTSAQYSKSIVSEIDAMRALAAWIIADTPEEDLKVGLNILQSDPHIRKFMP